jgi:hypothetical protein
MTADAQNEITNYPAGIISRKPIGNEKPSIPQVKSFLV